MLSMNLQLQKQLAKIEDMGFGKSSDLYGKKINTLYLMNAKESLDDRKNFEYSYP